MSQTDLGKIPQSPISCYMENNCQAGILRVDILIIIQYLIVLFRTNVDQNLTQKAERKINLGLFS